MSSTGQIHRKQVYPAKAQPLGTPTGYPANGWFSMHLTYPDTQYEDDPWDATWQYGQNTNSWRQGVTVLVKTPISSNHGAATQSPTQPNVAACEAAVNVVLVDLKQAGVDAAAAGSSLTFDMGTEEATRLIAARINSTRSQTTGERGLTRYLRARYVRMSGATSYSGTAESVTGANTLRVLFSGGFNGSHPSDLPDQGTLTVVKSGAPVEYSYTGVSIVADPTHWANGGNQAYVDFTIAGIASTVSGSPLSPPLAVPLTPATVVNAAPAQHTIVLSWEKKAASAAGGYWAPANAGPVFQGIGQSVPLWYLTAKPMDGGNMGLPAINYDSRGNSAVAHGSNHGYSRFSIEGLNSCDLPDMPPPDYTIIEPAIQGVTETNPYQSAAASFKIAALEYGSKQPTLGPGGYSSWTGHTLPCAAVSVTNSLNGTRDEISNHDASASFPNSLVKAPYTIYSARPFFATRPLNTSIVTGLQISNEERVFESIEFTDDVGNTLILEGGSPFGTVIRDFVVNNVREDADSGTEVVGPSTVNGKRTPNLRIQVPDPDDIPGEIFVRTGHDRVQAWSNLTWGMGGLSPPNPENSGVLENDFLTNVNTLYGTYDAATGNHADSVSRAQNIGDVSQFDTHDRMLVFHCQRILHPDITTKHGLTTSQGLGAVPSGTTRLYSAHRITDHAERGSVLYPTLNGVKQTEGYPVPYPHSRIRFARQGHSFVTPLSHRGTPFGMRRQLHRSHGSAYTLMFEAETENKHFGFLDGDYSGHSATKATLDTLERRDAVNAATGSFASDGLPMDEMTDGWVIPDSYAPYHAAYGSGAHRTEPDYLIAPGQVHTNVEGRSQTVIEVTPGDETTPTTRAGPSKLTFASSVPARNRYGTCSEFMINGFILSDYLLGGGRPETAEATENVLWGNGQISTYFVRGLEWGCIVPRSATELATVPPLLAHDPDYANMAASPVNGVIPSDDYWDMGLLNETDTNTGCKPDAFLCTWLAEYNHPALLGGVREHFMMFRYRESGMPRSVHYPSVRGLLLRNHSRLSLSKIPNTTASGSAAVVIVNNTDYRLSKPLNALPFERIYVTQWLQNYGYNGLNAGGHGNTVSELKSAGSVLMGHTTAREAAGTLTLMNRVPNAFGVDPPSTRYSRGEGIGDGINPDKVMGITTIEIDGPGALGPASIKYHYPLDAMVCYDFSRRLPVRAWGIRTASDALDMLAGDPLEVSAASQPIFGRARFDGGVHDSVQKIPDATAYGSNWKWDVTFTGMERSTPIGLVMSGHTVESTPFFGAGRYSNEPVVDEPIGIGRALGATSAGMLTPTAMAAGIWDITSHPNGTFDLTNHQVISKGSDPMVSDLDETGIGTNSPATVSGTGFGTAINQLRGNALHTNSGLVPPTLSKVVYPANSWMPAVSTSHHSPIPLSEISDHRQVQSRAEPRLGLIIETESERLNSTPRDYSIIGTKAASLHTDLIVGQHFPILPSWTVNAKFTSHDGSSIRGATAQVVADADAYANKPYWSLDSDTTKGAVGVVGDTVIINSDTTARDAWTVRGGADLPPWGGVFILRKTYLNRFENGSISSSKLEALSGRASASHPRRQYVDYLVRSVRNVKMYGFASDVLQDGWVHGPRSSYVKGGVYPQIRADHFHRDKRYGVFELNTGKATGLIDLISASDGAFMIDWPDANDHDITHHLIPSSAMLQFFKSDSVRTLRDGEFISEIEARFSQMTHPGGSEIVSQSESRYANDGTGVTGDHARQIENESAQAIQPQDTARYYPRVVVNHHKVTDFQIVVDDASLLPSSGTLFMLDVPGVLKYTSVSGNIITYEPNTAISTLLLTFSDLLDKSLYFTVSETRTHAASPLFPQPTGIIQDLRTTERNYPALPSLIDNAIVLGDVATQPWFRKWYDSGVLKITKTSLSYRGLLHYSPSDFIMASQRSFLLSDGTGEGPISPALVKSGLKSQTVIMDGQEISESFSPPYIFDSDGGRWRISKIKTRLNGTLAIFRNISGDTLSGGGIKIGNVLGGQYGTIGVRTTDAALIVLNDASSEIAGFNLIPTQTIITSSQSIASMTGAHPNLRDILDHSKLFISRNTRGLNIMQVIRNLSQIDGHQLVNEPTGLLLYSANVFRETGIRLGSDSGARDISVNRMFDSPNEVIIEGDRIANNERVTVTVQDTERMRAEGGAGSKENHVRTYRQRIPGLKTNSEALRLAKSLLSRIENGAPLVRVMGMVRATSIRPGDIVQLDLPAHGLRGPFAVFEAIHNYEEGMSDFILGQYDKGIEGLISDIQATVGNMDATDVTSRKTVDLTEIALSGGFKIISVHRIMIRSNNNTGFIIGARHNTGMGKIGVRDGNKRGLPIGTSKSRTYVVK